MIKNRVFNVRCIVKWGGKTKIDKVPFWGAKKDFKTTGECYNLKLKKKKRSKNPSQPSIKNQYYYMFFVCLFLLVDNYILMC